MKKLSEIFTEIETWGLTFRKFDHSYFVSEDPYVLELDEFSDKITGYTIKELISEIHERAKIMFTELAQKEMELLFGKGVESKVNFTTGSDGIHIAAILGRFNWEKPSRESAQCSGSGENRRAAFWAAIQTWTEQAMDYHKSRILDVRDVEVSITRNNENVWTVKAGGYEYQGKSLQLAVNGVRVSLRQNNPINDLILNQETLLTWSTLELARPNPQPVVHRCPVSAAIAIERHNLNGGNVKSDSALLESFMNRFGAKPVSE